MPNDGRPAETADNSAGLQRPVRGRPFPKGVSGNPAGRREGSRNTATLVLEAIADGNAAEVLEATFRSAVKGNAQSQRVYLERVMAPRKDRPVVLGDMPDFVLADPAGSMGRITAFLLARIADGTISPDEAKTISGVMSQMASAAVLDDLKRQIDDIRATARLGRGNE